MSNTLPENVKKFKETASLASEQDLLQNYLHRVAIDNTIQNGAYEILTNIMLNTSYLKNNSNIVIATPTDDTKTELVTKNIYANERIIIFDISLSCNGVGIISFLDQDDNDLLSKFYSASAGDSMNRTSDALILPKGKKLYIKSSTSITYSVDVNYTIYEE